MPTAPDAVLDAGLDLAAAADEMWITSAAPADYAGIAGVALAGPIALTPGDGNGDFTLADGTPDGRTLSVAAQSGTASASGTATHVVLATGGGTDLLRYVTELASSVALTSSAPVDVGAWSIRNAAPAAA